LEEAFMDKVLFVLQVVSALLFIVLMAIQTDKNEQSGVMGLGAQGGRMSGSIDMPVGAERILKPMSKWAGIGFISRPLGGGELDQWRLALVCGRGAIGVYLFVMILGNQLWSSFFACVRCGLGKTSRR
jgi:preprotein translocase subunit SecG